MALLSRLRFFSLSPGLNSNRGQRRLVGSPTSPIGSTRTDRHRLVLVIIVISLYTRVESTLFSTFQIFGNAVDIVQNRPIGSGRRFSTIRT